MTLKKEKIEEKREMIMKRKATRDRYRTALKKKVSESLTAVLPITVIVLILSFTITPIPVSALMSFVFGAVLLIVGMGLFTMGAEMSMTPLGERVGVHMTKSRKLWLIIILSFILGAIITISEPDLQVLANQVPTIPNMTLILAVAVGVGFFLVVALLRVVFGIPLNYLLIGFYSVIFLLVIFVPKEFLAVAFDSGGVTTGPMTVPFIMALGVGAASIRSDKHAGNDSFGYVALCSIGPIMAVLILGMAYQSDGGAYVPVTVPEISDSRSMFGMFLKGFPTYIVEMAMALAPIIVFFLIFQVVALKMGRRQVIKMTMGFLYTFVGLVLFLTGVNIGFSPVGSYLGKVIAELPFSWIIIPIAMLIGYYIVSAEPAVHVLNKQVEEITSGAIPRRAMSISLSIGVSLSLGLAMIRVMTGISVLWFLIPGYLIAIALTFYVPKIFTAIAFDSGGVASGPMTATFLLPFAIGASEAFGGNVVADAFGVVAMVAMTPLITIQIMGVFYKIKLARKTSAPDSRQDTVPMLDEDIIEYD